MRKKVLSLVLALAMALGMTQLAFAANTSLPGAGNEGKTTTLVVNEAGDTLYTETTDGSSETYIFMCKTSYLEKGALQETVFDNSLLSTKNSATDALEYVTQDYQNINAGDWRYSKEATGISLTGIGTAGAEEWTVFGWTFNKPAANTLAQAEVKIVNGKLETPFEVKADAVPKQTGKVDVNFTALDLSTYVSGGSGTYQYAVTTGTLPAGLTLTGSKITGKPTKATTADVTVTVMISDAKDATKSGTKDITFAIAKGVQTLAGQKAVTVNEGKTDASVTITGAKGELSVTSSDTGKATATIDKTTGKITVTGVAEGSATITVSAAATADYEAATDVTFTVTVNPASAPVFTVKDNTYTYDGTAKTATVTATVENNPVAADKITVTYGGAADQTNANETGYEIKATVDGKEYTLTEKLVIEKAELKVTLENNAIGNTLSQVTAKLEGVAAADKGKLSAAIDWKELPDVADPDNPDSTVAGTAANTKIEAGKEYKFGITITGNDDGNYNVTLPPAR